MNFIKAVIKIIQFKFGKFELSRKSGIPERVGSRSGAARRGGASPPLTRSYRAFREHRIALPARVYSVTDLPYLLLCS